MTASKFGYDRSLVKSGILHFGVGNFHRAHLESYTNALIKTGANDWGICGAMLMPQDEKLYNALKSQDGKYSLTVCGRDGKNEIEWIGSLVELLWSGADCEAIINKVADASIKIITLTITEGGYNLETDAVKSDIVDQKNPKSVFGIVAEGLRRRIAAGNGPITILSCDNLQHNGDTCGRIFTEFFAAQDPELAVWAKENITFPNSMVDRITPATTPADVERINATLDEQDLAPVYCEDFIQWVVEDKFIAGRPEWEKVGVEFTDDVAPYENMKLSLLNASHTLLSYPSFLSGFRKVDEAMKNETIVKFVRDFMNIDVTPYVPAPGNTDLEEYKQILVERFANAAVSDQIARLCGDGMSKFPVYVMPIAKQMVANGDDMTRVAYLIAAYRQYIGVRKDDNGEAFEIFEPTQTESFIKAAQNPDAMEFLKTAPFEMVDLSSSEAFKSKYLEMVTRIQSDGAMTVLKSITE